MSVSLREDLQNPDLRAAALGCRYLVHTCPLLAEVSGKLKLHGDLKCVLTESEHENPAWHQL